MMTLSGLYLYPMKSAQGHALSEWPLDALGLARDRRYMAVDTAGRFMTQRRHPIMALLQTELVDDGLVLRFPGQGEHHVTRPTGAEASEVEIWGESVAGHDTGEDTANWLSTALGQACRLVFMAEDTHRPVDANYASPGDRVSFADGFPLLLISQASLDELNGRLQQPITMARFRPNLVVSGTAPFAEDDWRRIQIGDTVLDIVKPCARCVMTTVDPLTGIKGKEPMKTLSTYRTIDGNVIFGQNVIHRSRGLLRVGERVEVLA